MVLRIDRIDTKEQAQIFAERLVSSSQIYFLDGAWGSGKSEYLKNVESYLPKQFKFVQLTLWKPSSKATLAKKLFAVTNPYLSFLGTFLGWVLISIMVFGSIVLTYESVMPTSNTRDIPLLITAIAVIVTTLYGFLKRKWLDVDCIRMVMSSWTLRSKRHHKILVVDDFDRLDENLQRELYILFNSVRAVPSGLLKAFQEPARVVFVGDLRKLKNTEDNYLGKIIDQKVALPFRLQSNSVAHYMAIKLTNELGCDCSMIKGLFTEEKRTLRDANQFLAYVEQEVIEERKAGKVQLDQELFVIYLYVFHPDKYRMLLDGWLPESKGSKEVVSPTNGKVEDKKHDTTLVTELMQSMFQPRSSNPPDFQKNKSAYFVNELATNHSLFELREIIDSDSETLVRLLSTNEASKDAWYEEFCYFIENMVAEEYETVQQVLEQSAMLIMRSEVRHQPNSLIRLIFRRRCDAIIGKNRDIHDKDLIIKYNEIFASAGVINPTECMFYYRTCLDLYGRWEYEGGYISRSVPSINNKNVMEYFSDTARTVEANLNFGTNDYDAEALIVQLGYSYYLDGPIDPHVNPDFRSKVGSIEKLKPSEYQAFWKTYNIQPWENDRTVLTGSKALDFDYRGQKYSVNVLNRLTRGSNQG